MSAIATTGGNENSVFSNFSVEGGVSGQKPKMGRANLVFLDNPCRTAQNSPTKF